MSQPTLMRFERLIWKNKSSLDPAQVPATGAVVTFYRQGATVSAEVAVPVIDENQQPPCPDPRFQPPCPTLISVYDSGLIVAGDVVQVSNQNSLILYVVEVKSDRTGMYVLNSGFSPVLVPKYARLVKLTDQPLVYSDPRGTQAIGTQVVTPADGRVQAYVAEARFDYIVSGGGLTTPRLYQDARGGVSPSPSWLNARDFPTLQAAVDGLPATGGDIFIPAGKYQLFATLVIGKPNVTLRGQGRGSIITAPANPGYDLIRIEKGWARLLDLAVDGNATSSSAAKACVVATGAEVERCYLKNVLMQKASGPGLLVRDVTSVIALNCECSSNKGDGFRIGRSNATPWKVRIIACTADHNDGVGVLVAPDVVDVGDSMTLLGCSMKGNGVLGEDGGSGLEVRNASGVQVMGCRFDWDRSGVAPAQLLYALGANALMVDGCWFEGKSGPAENAAARGTKIVDSVGAAFLNNSGRHLTTALVELHQLTKAVEFGNSDLDSPMDPRITVVGDGVFGLSKGVVQLYGYSSDPSPPPGGFPSGSMVWVGGGVNRIRVRDGNTWKSVQLS
jgi:hypothetical protein